MVWARCLSPRPYSRFPFRFATQIVAADSESTLGATLWAGRKAGPFFCAGM